MNIPQAQVINQVYAEKLISEMLLRKLSISYLKEKHQLIIQEGHIWLAKIYLPWNLEWRENREIKENEDSHYSLVLIRAGQAAVGYFHNGELLDHRVFRAYMVRQKQGVSQIKHLKTKGKSRAGSRIRLAETERFFGEINERLLSYSARFPVDFWGISCAKTMWPFYFSAAVPPPFSSKSENLIELPFHIAQASLDELKSAGQLIRNFHLILSDRGKEIFANPGDLQFDSAVSEDW